MHFGICLPHYGRTATFDGVRQVALLAEQLGYASLWTTDHVAVPSENIEPYGNIFESLTTLAMVATLTQRVRLGTSILVLPQRDPVLAAKQIATIDRASGGRLIVGLGVGWNELEYRHLGFDFHTRGKRLDEDIAVLRALWSQQEVTYNGKWTHLENVMSMPLPAQAGGPPIWIGGNEEPSWRRAAKLGDGWQTTGASAEEMAHGIARINELRPANKQLTYSARLSIDINPNTSPTYQYRGNARYRLAGTLDAIRKFIRGYAQVGVDHIALVFPDDLNTALAQIEQFAKELMPEFK